jgi:hypothetical protein
MKKKNFFATLKSLKKGAGSRSVSVPYPLVRVKDMRIRIRTKMSRIPNTDSDMEKSTANIRQLVHNAEFTQLLTSTWHQSEGSTESCPSAIISGPLATTSSTRPRAFCRMEMACWCEMLLSRTCTLKLRQYTTSCSGKVYSIGQLSKKKSVFNFHKILKEVSDFRSFGSHDFYIIMPPCREEPREECTVVFALIVTEPASQCVCV